MKTTEKVAFHTRCVILSHKPSKTEATTDETVCTEHWLVGIYYVCHTLAKVYIGLWPAILCSSDTIVRGLADGRRAVWHAACLCIKIPWQPRLQCPVSQTVLHARRYASAAGKSKRWARSRWANEPNILNDEPGNGEPFATVENEWLQLPVIYKRVINKRLR